MGVDKALYFAALDIPQLTLRARFNRVALCEYFPETAQLGFVAEPFFLRGSVAAPLKVTPLAAVWLRLVELTYSGLTSLRFSAHSKCVPHNR